MSETAKNERLATLRRQLSALERIGRRQNSVLPFGIEAIDAALPRGGLTLGALHEIFGSEGDGSATGFLAGILARLPPQQSVLWSFRNADLHAAGLTAHGFAPSRLILVRARNSRELLWAMEEGLRCAALAAVVGEVESLSTLESRRLQLAAERSGVTGFALRRRDSEKRAPTTAITCWKISALPSDCASREPGIGKVHWQVELKRCRGGIAGSWIVEACDAAGSISLPAALADRAPARQVSSR